MSHQVLWVVLQDSTIKIFDLPSGHAIKSWKPSTNTQLQDILSTNISAEGKKPYLAIHQRTLASAISSPHGGEWLILSPMDARTAKNELQLSTTAPGQSSNIVYFLHTSYLNGKVQQHLSNYPQKSHSSLKGINLPSSSTPSAPLGPSDKSDLFNTKDLSPWFKIIVSDRWTTFALTPDEQYLIAGTTLGKLLVWKISTGCLMAIIPAHFQKIAFIRISSDGVSVVTGTTDAQLKMWFLQDLLSYDPAMESAKSQLLNSRQEVDDQMQKKINRNDNILQPVYCVESLFSDMMTDVVLNCGKWHQANIVVSSRDGKCKILSLATGSILGTFVFPDAIEKVLVDPLETILIAGSVSGAIYLFYLNQTNFIDSRSSRSHRGLDVIFTHPGNNTAEESILTGGGGHQCQITALSLTLDATCLVSGDASGQVILWDLHHRINLKNIIYSEPEEKPFSSCIFLQVTLLPPFLLRSPSSADIHAGLVEKPLVQPFKKIRGDQIERGLVRLKNHAPSSFSTVSSVTIPRSTNSNFLSSCPLVSGFSNQVPGNSADRAQDDSVPMSLSSSEDAAWKQKYLNLLATHDHLRKKYLQEAFSSLP